MNVIIFLIFLGMCPGELKSESNAFILKSSLEHLLVIGQVIMKNTECILF